MLPITKNITSVNRTVKSSRTIKGIVIHWVGSVSSALNNSAYFKSVNRSASAHYFVDEKSIYQVVEDKDVAWHCGASKYYNPTLRNSNTIGVEMCLDSVCHISDQTIENTVELVRYLKKKYNISDENIVRHFDITHKNCPAPYVSDNASWNKLHARICTVAVDFKAGLWYKVLTSIPVRNGYYGDVGKYKYLSDKMKQPCENKDGYGYLKAGAVVFPEEVKQFADGSTWFMLDGTIACMVVEKDGTSLVEKA